MASLNQHVKHGMKETYNQGQKQAASNGYEHGSWTDTRKDINDRVQKRQGVLSGLKTS